MSKIYSESIHYTKACVEDVQQLKEFEYSSIDYAILDNVKGWNLNKKKS